MTRFVVPAVAAVVLALSSCGGGDSSSEPTTPVDADVTIVAIEGIAWDAESYSVTATDGEVVILGRNDSSLLHNLFLIDAEGVQQTTSIDLPRRGDAVAKTFALEPGEYTVICTIPGHTNMKATLTVN